MPVNLLLPDRLLVDPVKTRRLESKYWFRFRPGTLLPPALDFETLESRLATNTHAGQATNKTAKRVGIEVIFMADFPRVKRNSGRSGARRRASAARLTRTEPGIQPLWRVLS